MKTKNLKKFEQMFEPFRGTIIVNCQQTQKDELYAIREGLEIQFTKDFTKDNVAKFIEFNSIKLLTGIKNTNVV